MTKSQELSRRGGSPEDGGHGTDGAVPGDVLDRLDRAADLSTVQEIVRSAARLVSHADGATFVLRDVDHCFYADEDAISPLWKGQRFPLTQCISGWAMLHSQTVVIRDITVDERIPIEAYRPTFVKSLAMVPIGVDKPIGAIGAYWATTHVASTEEVAALEGLAEATHLAMERVGLFDAPSLPTFSEAGDTGSDPVDRAGAGLVTSADHERIARDLHDTVLQRLFGVGLQLQGLAGDVGDDRVATQVDEAVDQIDRAIRELRGVIFGLEYGHGRLGGLEGEILAAAAEASRTLGFKPSVTVEGSLDGVDDELRRDVMGVLGELLSNIGRHARASKVSVTLTAGATLELRVADDGVGLGDDPVRGNGLDNLERRARLRGGSFAVAAGDPKGTVATWRVRSH